MLRKRDRGRIRIDGRPVTDAEILKYCDEEEARWNRPAVATEPRFCNRCTAPLEISPCPICRKYQLRRIAELRELIAS